MDMFAYISISIYMICLFISISIYIQYFHFISVCVGGWKAFRKINIVGSDTLYISAHCYLRCIHTHCTYVLTNVAYKIDKVPQEYQYRQFSILCI